MLFNSIKSHKHIIESYKIIVYDKDGPYLRIKAEITLTNGGKLFIRQYIISNEILKYSYHWQTSEGLLLCRWDNAPHWPDITTNPHHLHVDDKKGAFIVKESILAGDFELILKHIEVKMKQDSNV